MKSKYYATSSDINVTKIERSAFLGHPVLMWQIHYTCTFKALLVSGLVYIMHVKWCILNQILPNRGLVIIMTLCACE